MIHEWDAGLRSPAGSYTSVSVAHWYLGNFGCFTSKNVIYQLISQQKADFKDSCMRAEYITNSGFYLYQYFYHIIFYR